MFLNKDSHSGQGREATWTNPLSIPRSQGTNSEMHRIRRQTLQATETGDKICKTWHMAWGNDRLQDDVPSSDSETIGGRSPTLA